MASDRVKGDRREDRAFVLLLSVVSIICGLVKQKIKDKKNERKEEERRTNDSTWKQIIIIIIIIVIVLITHIHSDWVTRNRRNTNDLTKWSDCEPRPSCGN